MRRGLHTQTMASAGADVTAVDLTSTAVEATTRRLAMKGLSARILRCDAERLAFPDHGVGRSGCDRRGSDVDSGGGYHAAARHEGSERPHLAMRCGEPSIP